MNDKKEDFHNRVRQLKIMKDELRKKRIERIKEQYRKEKNSKK